ncbi:Metallo-dependent hydrolase [Sistotremastrum niveocremeum HHB9708]|uniref:Metallo-dependent hydrolase n=1 Tax=Sistotremastrum niveocremeum HHB9708 TaxID=1314777 RepID=A0A164U4E1_9AGAM|nr:Metallo-dependent hydrolase [Sistotremastrum niveocremeum HHB9708]
MPSTLTISNVHLPGTGTEPDNNLYTVVCGDAQIVSINAFETDATHSHSDWVDANGGLLIPSTFDEALQVTSQAKAKFTSDDLLARGRRLIQESILFGVTCMRAHVEVDDIVQYQCLDAAVQLKREFANSCDILISVFAQDPFWKSDDVNQSANLTYLRESCLRTPEITSIGSAPYVENSPEKSLRNIQAVVDLALQHNLHLDFHLDYNLSESNEPMIFDVISELNRVQWSQRMPTKHITIGHATRLTLLDDGQLRELRLAISTLPISFVGLPQSDVYIMGRGDSRAPRGMLNVPILKREYDLDVAIAVNNVGNAFTPQGEPDPLSLCPLGVALYQASTPADCHSLLEAVSIGSHRAVGRKCAASLRVKEGNPSDVLILHGTRQSSITQVVLAPSVTRTTIKNGRIVAKRTVIDHLVQDT